MQERDEDQADVFENLRSKVERNRLYIQALLQQHEKLKKEKDVMEEKLNFELKHQKAVTKDSMEQLAKLTKDWQAKSELMAEAEHVFNKNKELNFELTECNRRIKELQAQLELRNKQ